MKITIKEIEKLANLSQLELSQKEQGSLSKDLTAILDFVAELQQADVSAIKIDLAVQASNQREDKIEDCLPSVRELVLKNVPEKKDNLIKVKAVFDFD